MVGRTDDPPRASRNKREVEVHPIVVDDQITPGIEGFRGLSKLLEGAACYGELLGAIAIQHAPIQDLGLLLDYYADGSGGTLPSMLSKDASVREKTGVVPALA